MSIVVAANMPEQDCRLLQLAILNEERRLLELRQQHNAEFAALVASL